MILRLPETAKTPYQEGYANGLAGKGCPAHFPRGDAAWDEKLYSRGWTAGNEARCAQAGAAS